MTKLSIFPMTIEEVDFRMNPGYIHSVYINLIFITELLKEHW